MTIFYVVLTTAVIAITVVSMLTFLLSQMLTVKHFRSSAPPPVLEPAPKVSILKPTEGAGEETYEAFASFCRLDYPGETEIVVGTIRRDDAIAPIVERLRRNYPTHNIRLLFAEPRGANRKAGIMEVLWREAAGDWLFFSDADVVVSPDYLKRLMPLLTQPGVGCLTCLPRGVGIRTLGDKLIALHYDFNYLPQWMLAMHTTGIKWAIGHTMAVHKDILRRLNGFNGWLDHLADDYELGCRIARLGLKVIVPPYLIDCYMPRESIRAAFRRLQRWKRTMRRARGAAFVGSSLTYPVFWSSLLVVLQPFVWWSWTALACIVAIRVLTAARLQSCVRLPDWQKSWWLLPMVDLIEGITFLGAYTGNSIHWAGRRYTLAPDGTLTPWTKDAKKN